MQVNVTWKEFTALVRSDYKGQGEVPNWIKRTANILVPEDRRKVEEARSRGELVYLVPHVNLPSQRVQCV
jgi:hypothetical protein